MGAVDQAPLILSEHDIEPEETAQKDAIADVLAILDEKEPKDIKVVTGHWRGRNSGDAAPVRSVEKESRWSAP